MTKFKNVLIMCIAWQIKAKCYVYLSILAELDLLR